MREHNVIAITNSKGGVGKTTTALNLGAALTAKEKKVLLVDNDPQGNLTAALGYTPGEQRNTLAKLLLVQIDSPEDLPLHLPRSVIHTEVGMDLIPANKRLADAAARLQVMQLSQYNAAGASNDPSEKIMATLLTSFYEQYDYIIIDCGLKHELLTINALAAADYCIIRKEVKDPKGTTIISMKETIERSREFLEALKKTKEKNPCCYVKPKVEMKTKGNAAYKGKFGSLEEARASDKVICLVPARNGRIYELCKMEQGEFIAPKNNVADFSEIRAGFTPALPKIPAQLMGQIIAFFRTFMTENEENEALALIYWDKAEKRFFAYVPKQSVCKEEVEADLRGCPYDDEERYICYADIHSHNSMEAFFSGKDDRDERSTGLYFVLGELDHFYPTLKARIFCGDSFVPIDPAEVVEGLEQPFPQEWLEQVSIRRTLPKKEKKRSLREFLSEVW